MNELSQVRQCRLLDSRVHPPLLIDATLSRGFSADMLEDVEVRWRPARIRLATAMAAAGLNLENGHWDWRNKAGLVQSNKLLIFSVQCDGEVQGLMALVTRPRPAHQLPAGSVVYVDFLESAPWNLGGEGVQQPRFMGVGTVLIGAAVQESLDLGFGGRVGLHSLPQAVSFYSGRCQMTRCGEDPKYYDLEYLEYGDDVALQWLTDKGLRE